jgi:hypothetical protein
LENKWQSTISTKLNEKEKALLVEVSKELNVPCNRIMRRLVHYIMEGKIEWLEIIRKSKDFLGKLKPSGDVDNSNTRSFIVRTNLPPDLHGTFTRLAEEWGSTPNMVLRKLVLLYVAGGIERGEIWK